VRHTACLRADESIPSITLVSGLERSDKVEDKKMAFRRARQEGRITSMETTKQQA